MKDIGSSYLGYTFRITTISLKPKVKYSQDIFFFNWLKVYDRPSCPFILNMQSPGNSLLAKSELVLNIYPVWSKFIPILVLGCLKNSTLIILFFDGPKSIFRERFDATDAKWRQYKQSRGSWKFMQGLHLHYEGRPFKLKHSSFGHSKFGTILADFCKFKNAPLYIRRHRSAALTASTAWTSCSGRSEVPKDILRHN